MSGKHQHAASAEKKAHIQAVALELFQKNGFEQTTVQDISRESGFSYGSIYNFFHSKVDILTYSIDQVYDTSVALLEPTPENLQNPQHALCCFFDQYVNFFDEFGRDLTRVILQTSLDAPEKLHFEKQVFRKDSDLFHFCKAIQATGRLPASVSSETLFLHIHILVKGTFNYWVTSAACHSLRELLHTQFQLVFLPLSA